ncbi:hypothetical protein L211DRAFT_852895 [Terfezia boudieri ATCC MYA-4762]|uniref:CCHC-type domain-containing protein n=1 Tax=Terfezia boudieri ATCC MYA-4762 TaxID=1051890 RepID=A0A3N4LE74_9PEZI|nr:hypothetical protein L211DRAFT_852895 [Terfezia boudieri ATCC MYA-4762]
MKKAEELEKKIEAEAAVPTENLVDLEGTVGKVKNLLKVKGLTEGYTPWQVSMGAKHGEPKDESTWTVKRVKEDADPLRVVGEVGKALIGVFGRTEEILNIWVEDPKSVQLLVPSAPLMVPRGRKALGEKIKEENKDLRMARRLPKLWGSAKVTEFIFDVADSEEAKRIIKSGLMWEGQRRKVSYFEREPRVWPTNVWSNIHCNKCKGLGHMRKDCMVSPGTTVEKYTRKFGVGLQMTWPNKRLKDLDKEGF